MKTVIAIPARMESTRLPGKPLVELCGKPLISYAVKTALECEHADDHLVVTDSSEIVAWCESEGVPYFFDKDPYNNGTERIGGAMSKGAFEADNIINLQCDEPDLTGADLDILASRSPYNTIYTLACPLVMPLSGNPSTVKVSTRRMLYGNDGWSEVLYFSRSSLPSAMAHIGVYYFSDHYVDCYSSAIKGHLEMAENLEQNRLFSRNPCNDNGLIKEETVDEIECQHFDFRCRNLGRPVRGINTPEDIVAYEAEELAKP